MAEEVRSCDVWRKVCCAPLDKNKVWKWLWRPLIIFFASCVALGLLYLYLVPFTNVVGKALFADYKCYPDENVWGVCGRINCTKDAQEYFDPNGKNVSVGFLVFLIIQVTVGCLITGITLLSCSRRFGFFQKLSWEYVCCACCQCGYYYPGRRENGEASYGGWEPEDNYDINRSIKIGRCLALNSIWVLFMSTLSTLAIIGVWGGRAIAVLSVEQCKPFIGTRIGLYGCVDDATGAYVGGMECRNCAAVGFGILGVPLLCAATIVTILYFAIPRVVRYYRRQRAELQAQRDAQYHQQQRFMKAQVVVVPEGDEVSVDHELCCVCIDTLPNVRFRKCGHTCVCSKCLPKLGRTCPLCRESILGPRDTYDADIVTNVNADKVDKVDKVVVDAIVL